MMVRIDDWQVGIEDLLAHVCQPVFANAGHARGNGALRLAGRHASSCPGRRRGPWPSPRPIVRGDGARTAAVRLALARRWPLPTAGGRIVTGARINPCGPAVGGDLLLPEGRAGLEVVHQELGGGEGGLAVRRGGHDQHDVVARARARRRDARSGWPAAASARGLGLDARKLALRHARIVLERHAGDRAGRHCRRASCR